MVHGHRVRYLTGGDGPPLLLVHGLMGYSFSWTEVLPALARRHRVFAPDMLNLGLSDRADVEPTLAAISLRMIAFLDAVRVGATDVIGSSHGGTIAMQMAASHRTRVQKMILAAPSHPWSERARWQIRLFSSIAGAPLAAFMALAPRLWMAIGLYRLYGRSSRMPRGTVAGYAQPMRDRRTLHYLLQLAREWDRDFERLQPNIAALVDVPTLLIWGDRDPIVPLATARELLSRLHCAELKVIEDCGHLPYEEKPAEFLAIVEAYLQAAERCRA